MDADKEVILSVICPSLNEENFIENLLSFFVHSKPKNKELFIIDGGSIDKTRKIVQDWSKKYENIHLLDNPDKYVPFALNKAISKCNGEYIVRLDAHTEYADDYFEQILQTFPSSGADIVGGPTRTRSKNSFQASVAYAICTQLGVGDSKVHQLEYEGPSDSVTFGAWKKQIFETTGMFDTELIRNQDDEFHYRAKSKGFRIYQNPAIKLYYYPRSTLKGLFSQYFQYGLYKPLVLKKVNSEIKLRHLIPSGFVLYLVWLPFLFLWHWVLLIPLILYAILAIFFSFRNHLPIKSKLFCLLVYPALHISYGSGFLLGLRKILRKNG